MRNASRNALIVAIAALALVVGVRATEGADNEKMPEESFANSYATMLHADTEMVQSQAAWVQAVHSARKMAVEAAKAAQQVYSLKLDNDLKVCETHYTMRERREAHRAKTPRTRPDHETYVRLCNATRPKKLLKYQFDPDRGKISWPYLLNRPEFEQQREEMEALFALGTASSSGPNSDFQYQVDGLSRQMQKTLEDMVRDVNQMEYSSAKCFLRGLCYEARCLPQLESVADAK
jgi:hypothetical protein